METILLNDQFVKRDPLIDIEDRGYQFGDGVYEVIGVYNRMPFMMDEHMERLERSANEIELKLPYDTLDLKKRLLELVVENDLIEGIIYLQVSRGTASRWHEFPPVDTPAVTVAYTREEKRLTTVEDEGAKAILTEDIRWLRCDIKTLNLLPNVMAKQKAVEANAIEAILHRGDIVTEASASNVFIVQTGELYTHPANRQILNGITRRKILELCQELDLMVHEKAFTISDLLAADEVFISATKLDIIPIIKVEDRVIGEGIPGKVTKRVLDQFRIVLKQLESEVNMS